MTTDIAAAETAPTDPVKLARDKFRGWPSKTFEGPQPWDLVALGIDQEGRAVEGDDHVTPVLPLVGLPMLTSGSRGPEVIELARTLGKLGYPNSISKGSIDNAFGIVDDSIMLAVEAFRRDYHVAEDPAQFVRDPQNNVSSHIGPWTQEAIYRVAERDTADDGE